MSPLAVGTLSVIWAAPSKLRTHDLCCGLNPQHCGLRCAVPSHSTVRAGLPAAPCVQVHRGVCMCRSTVSEIKTCLHACAVEWLLCTGTRFLRSHSQPHEGRWSEELLSVACGWGGCSPSAVHAQPQARAHAQPCPRSQSCVHSSAKSHTHTYTHSPVHGASSALSDSATQLSGCQGHRTVSASACGLLCPLLQALPEGIRAVTQQLQMLGVDGMGVQERGGCGAGAVGSCLHLALPGVPYEASACVCTCMRACMCMCACT